MTVKTGIYANAQSRLTKQLTLAIEQEEAEETEFNNDSAYSR